MSFDGAEVESWTHTKEKPLQLAESEPMCGFLQIFPAAEPQKVVVSAATTVICYSLLPSLHPLWSSQENVLFLFS